MSLRSSRSLLLSPPPAPHHHWVPMPQLQHPMKQHHSVHPHDADNSSAAVLSSLMPPGCGLAMLSMPCWAAIVTFPEYAFAPCRLPPYATASSNHGAASTGPFRTSCCCPCCSWRATAGSGSSPRPTASCGRLRLPVEEAGPGGGLRAWKHQGCSDRRAADHASHMNPLALELLCATSMFGRPSL